MGSWREMFRAAPVMTLVAAAFFVLAVINTIRGRDIQSGICTILALQCAIAADAKRAVNSTGPNNG